MVEAVQASPGQRVLDVATGTGLVARALVRRYGCQVVGLDQSEQMLGRARKLCAGIPQIELVRGEAERLPFDDASFDALTFTYLFRYVDDPRATLDELVRVVRRGGTVGMVEFGLPSYPWRAFWELYVRFVLPPAGGLIDHAWREVGRFLGPSIRAFYAEWPLPRQLELWRSAGVADVRVRRLSFGAGVVLWGTRA